MAAKRIPTAIRRLDLSAVEEKIHLEYGFNEDRRMRAMLGLQRFYTLCLEYPRMKLSPSPDIDKAWHQHILMTKKYADDCQTVFGCFLHHNPSLEPGKDEEMFKKTNRLFKKRFGEPMSGTGKESREKPPQKSLRVRRSAGCGGCCSTCDH